MLRKACTVCTYNTVVFCIRTNSFGNGLQSTWLMRLQLCTPNNMYCCTIYYMCVIYIRKCMYVYICIVWVMNRTTTFIHIYLYMYKCIYIYIWVRLVGIYTLARIYYIYMKNSHVLYTMYVSRTQKTGVVYPFAAATVAPDNAVVYIYIT